MIITEAAHHTGDEPYCATPTAAPHHANVLFRFSLIEGHLPDVL